MSEAIDVNLDDEEQKFLRKLLSKWADDARDEDEGARKHFNNMKSSIADTTTLDQEEWEIIKKIVAASIDENIGVNASSDKRVAKDIMVKLMATT